MKKTEKPRQKLQLTRETLRRLETTQLARIDGGGSLLTCFTCTVTTSATVARLSRAIAAT